MIPRHTHRSPHLLLFMLVGTLLMPLLPAQEDSTDTVEDPNPAGILLQRNHAGVFVGGEELIVQVSISATADESLFALGLYETVPSGWTFEGLYVDAGPSPDILPPQGATGVLEFGWVSPAVPVVLRYALRIPARDAGSRFITGQVEYRLESDPRRNSAPLMTQLDGVANEIPVVTLLGPALLPWSINTPFADPGAQAQDAEDGDLSNQVQVAGQVDVTTPGDYTLTYGVTDSAGNRANPVSRTVRVGAAETPDGGDPSPGEVSADPEMTDPDVPARPNAGPIPRSSKAQPGPNITVPPISLGTNAPRHALPPGEGEASAERDTPSSLPKDGRLFRETATHTPSPATDDGAKNALSTVENAPTSQAAESTEPVEWTARRTLTLGLILLFAIPAMGVALCRYPLFSPTRRRRR